MPTQHHHAINPSTHANDDDDLHEAERRPPYYKAFDPSATNKKLNATFPLHKIQPTNRISTNTKHKSIQTRTSTNIMSAENKSTEQQKAAGGGGWLSSISSGVTNTASGVAGTAGSVVGGVVGTAGGAVGSVGRGLGQTLGDASSGLENTAKGASGTIHDTTGAKTQGKK